MDKNLLVSAVNDYYNGGDFNEKARVIYNSYATFPSQLPYDEQHHYLLGIVFAGLAKNYSNDINAYTSILEDALFCFMSAMRKSSSQSERQCSAIRMLLLIENNETAMKGIVHKFWDTRMNKLYSIPDGPEIAQKLSSPRFLASKLTPWAYEIDILTHLGNYCIQMSSSADKHSYISVSEMKQFNSLAKSDKYYVNFPLVSVSMESVFDLFYKFIYEYITTPYERRMTRLY